MGLDVIGKCWVTHSGVVDVSGDEHARFARGTMLNIPPERIKSEIPIHTIFKQMTESDAKYYEELGVSRFPLDFLKSGNERGFVDPRVYAIKNYDWIRTVDDQFYAWDWNEDTIKRLMSCDEFWKKHQKVNKYTSITLISIGSGLEFRYSYEALQQQDDIHVKTGV